MGKKRPEKPRIWTLFTQCQSQKNHHVLNKHAPCCKTCHCLKDALIVIKLCFLLLLLCRVLWYHLYFFVIPKKHDSKETYIYFTPSFLLLVLKLLVSFFYIRNLFHILLKNIFSNLWSIFSSVFFIISGT